MKQHQNDPEPPKKKKKTTKKGELEALKNEVDRALKSIEKTLANHGSKTDDRECLNCPE